MHGWEKEREWVRNKRIVHSDVLNHQYDVVMDKKLHF
jgi:hypothetical protein